MDNAAAKRLVDEIKAKVQQRTATAGSESALRRLVPGLARGVPNDSELSPGLAQAAREPLPELQHTLGALGSLFSLKFMGVDPQGGDIYHTQFEHGFDEWHLAPDGEIRSAAVRPSL